MESLGTHPWKKSHIPAKRKQTLIDQSINLDEHFRTVLQKSEFREMNLYLKPLRHVAAVSGSQDDGVDVEHLAVDELHLSRGEALDSGNDLDVAGFNFGKSAHVENRGPPLRVLQLQRTGRWPPQSILLCAPEYKQSEHQQDLVHQP